LKQPFSVDSIISFFPHYLALLLLSFFPIGFASAVFLTDLTLPFFVTGADFVVTITGFVALQLTKNCRKNE
jgi:hypothetical protein